LTRETVVKLGRDLLEALEEVHKRGFVHRDIKPSNIFLVDRRALLADFGLTVESDTGAEHGWGAGTPGYMPPEQQRRGAVTPRTDLYALGMVLYECLTGRRWVPVPDGAPVDWSGVPRRIRRVLKRALAWNPEDRWPDATSFRRALWRTRRAATGALITVVAAAALLAGGVTARVVGVRELPIMDVALLPFAVNGADPKLGDMLPRLVAATLTLDVAPVNQALNLDSAALADTQRLFDRLHAKVLVGGRVDTVGASLSVQLDIRKPDGSHLGTPVVIDGPTEGAGCRLATDIVYVVAPTRMGESDCSSVLSGRSAEAVAAWLAGERAFGQQQWDTAAAYFERAVEIDPNYGLAKWRLWNARNWLREPQTVNLDTLYRREAARLPEVDRMLLDAMRTTLGPVRYSKFRETLHRYPYHAYAWLLYGDDLLNRGPLIGIPTDSAASILTKAAETDSSLSPAYQQLAWALIKLGRRDTADRAITHLQEVAGPGAAVDPKFFRLAYYLRFAPDTAAAAAGQFLGGGTWDSTAHFFLNRALRWGLAFEIPQGQLQIADQMLGIRGAPAEARAKMFTARGMALVSLGRIRDALAAFDSVAALTGDDQSALLDAQWPVMLADLGMGGVDSTNIEDARQRLGAFASTSRDNTVRTRAAWTLAVDAIVRNDEPGFRNWRARLDSSRWDGAGRLQNFADEWHLAETSDARSAASRSRLWMGTIAQSVPDLFFRTAVHLERGKWLAAHSDPDAWQSWVWYQHSDVVNWLDGPPQAGEVDWAFGTLAQYLLGQEAKRRGRYVEACRSLRTVADRWSDADAPLRSLGSQASTWVERECRG